MTNCIDPNCGDCAKTENLGGLYDDPVNHPSHYTQYPVEVIEITERLSFLMGNVVKYVLRADHKGEPIQDLEKARWYLDREIANRERLLVEQDESPAKPIPDLAAMLRRVADRDRLG